MLKFRSWIAVSGLAVSIPLACSSALAQSPIGEGIGANATGTVLVKGALPRYGPGFLITSVEWFDTLVLLSGQEGNGSWTRVGTPS